MVYYDMIKWDVIENNMVGRILLPNYLYVTIIPRGKVITAMAQHPKAEEQVFKSAEDVDKYLIKLSNITGEMI